MRNRLVGFQLILRAERLAAYFAVILGMHVPLMFIQLFLTAERPAAAVTLVLVLGHGIHSFRFFPFHTPFTYSFSPLFYITRRKRACYRAAESEMRFKVSLMKHHPNNTKGKTKRGLRMSGVDSNEKPVVWRVSKRMG